MVASRPLPSISSDLEALASAVASLDLGVAGGTDHWAGRRDRVVRTIRSYLIPRIRDPQRPLLVVFAGATGAGKSTLLNSVAGAELSQTGPLRPTTKAPVVFAAEGRAQAYHRIGGVECKVVTGKARILGELALVDTPDIDSTAAEHRAMAETLIDNADVVIFVSSAIRYADRLPWEVLRRSESRGAPVIPVLNRLRSSSEGALNDYRGLLRSEGLSAELVPVHEHHMASGRQLVPAAAVKGLRGRLIDLVEQRRDETSDTVMSVMSATVNQAVDVVDRAESRAEEAGVWNTRMESMFSPDVDRLSIRLEPRHLSGLDAPAISDLEGSGRFRIRRWLSRNGPSPFQASEARRQIAQLIAGSIEADLRRAVAEAGSRKSGQAIPESTHADIVGAVVEWGAAIDESLDVVGRPYRDAALLLHLALTVDDRPVYRDAFAVLAPDMNSHALRTSARWRLEAEVGPIYQRQLSRIRQAVGFSAATRREIQEARAAVSVITTRSMPIYA